MTVLNAWAVTLSEFILLSELWRKLHKELLLRLILFSIFINDLEVKENLTLIKMYKY